MLLKSTSSLLKFVKSTRLYALPVFLLLITTVSCFSQQHEKPKLWKAIVYTASYKITGKLYRTTDSSVVLMGEKGSSSEILYSGINKIKLQHYNGGAYTRVVGFVVGIYAGAGIGGSTFSHGSSEMHEENAGIIGALLGVVVGGAIGIFASPPIYKLAFTKRIAVQHDPTFYPLLKAKLRPYCIQKE